MPGPPFRGCRISTDFYCTAFATLGESTIAAVGGEMNRAAIKSLLNRGWAAFKRAGDENGIPDQGDIDDIHGAMFPDLPMPRLATLDFDDAWAAVGDSVLGIALRLSVLEPSDPLRQFTSADHQLCLFDRANDQGAVVDPMGPIGGDGKSRYWAKKSSIRKAALAIGNGRVVCELYPMGGWTAETLGTRRLRAASAVDEETIRRLRRERNQALAALKVCQDGTPPDCAPLISAARAEALAEAEAAVAALPR